MNSIKLAAIALMVAGVLGLAYGGFSYTKDTTVVKLGPLEICEREAESQYSFVGGYWGHRGGRALAGPGQQKRLIAQYRPRNSPILWVLPPQPRRPAQRRWADRLSTRRPGPSTPFLRCSRFEKPRQKTLAVLTGVAAPIAVGKVRFANVRCGSRGCTSQSLSLEYAPRRRKLSNR